MMRVDDEGKSVDDEGAISVDVGEERAAAMR